MAEYTPFKFRFYDKVDAPGDNPEVIVGGNGKIYIGDLSKPYNEWPVVYTNEKTYINAFGYGCDGYAESVSYKFEYTNYDGYTAEYQSSYSCPCKDLVNYLETGSPTTIYFTNEDEINTIKYSNSWKHVTKSNDAADYCKNFTNYAMSAKVDWGGNTINPILVSDVVSQDQLNEDGSRDIYIRKLRDNNSENAITYTIDVWPSNDYSGEKIGSITAIVYGAPTYTVTYVHPINISINQGDGGIDETIINCTCKTYTGKSNLYINAIADWKVGTAPNDLPTDKIKASQQKNVAYIDNYVLMIKVLKDCPEGSYSGNWPITYGPNNKYTYNIPYSIVIAPNTSNINYVFKVDNQIHPFPNEAGNMWPDIQVALIESYYTDGTNKVGVEPTFAINDSDEWPGNTDDVVNYQFFKFRIEKKDSITYKLVLVGSESGNISTFSDGKYGRSLILKNDKGNFEIFRFYAIKGDDPDEERNYYLGTCGDWNYISKYAASDDVYWPGEGRSALIMSYYTTPDSDIKRYIRPNYTFTNEAPDGFTYNNAFRIKMRIQIPGGEYKGAYVFDTTNEISTPKDAGKYGAYINFTNGASNVLNIPIYGYKSEGQPKIYEIIASINDINANTQTGKYAWIIVDSPVYKLVNRNTPQEVGREEDDNNYIGFLTGGSSINDSRRGWYWLPGPEPDWDGSDGTICQYDQMHVSSDEDSGRTRSALILNIRANDFDEKELVKKPDTIIFPPNTPVNIINKNVEIRVSE